MTEIKKVLILIGSPREKGNTSILCGRLERMLSEKGCEVEKRSLYTAGIGPCTDCRACKKEPMECPVADGMRDIYGSIDSCGVLVIGTPIYWFGPSANAKLLLDRFRPYYGNRRLEGKKAVLVLTAGSGPRDCDLTVEMFKRSFKALGAEFCGAVKATGFDEGDVLEDKQALEELDRLGGRLISG